MKQAWIQKLSIPLLTLVGLLLSVAWFAGLFNDKVMPNVTKPLVQNYKDVFTVTPQNTIVFEPIAATINAKQASIISSRILARIDEILVRAGDTVKEGQLLIKLEQAELQSQVLQAKEQVNVILARYIEAKKNFERSKDIHRQKLISDVVLDKSKADYNALLAELNTVKQVLKQVQTALSYTELRAPMDGRVVDRFTEPGNTAQPGNKLLSIYNPLSLRVEGQVREKLAFELTQGQTIEVQLPTSNQVLQAKIEEIVPAANTGSRSFLVKASIKYQEQLLPGMYARMLIPAGRENVIYLPKSRIAQVGQLSVIWVNEGGIAQRRFVRLGKETADGLVAIISGLQANEQVLVKP
jgi:RND family efflux transporter MFP subunit|tara:strand:- start:742 stop:1800 length:1059 start_codon:yes stop_codon:yes gene_type:complete